MAILDITELQEHRDCKLQSDQPSPSKLESAEGQKRHKPKALCYEKRNAGYQPVASRISTRGWSIVLSGVEFLFWEQRLYVSYPWGYSNHSHGRQGSKSVACWECRFSSKKQPGKRFRKMRPKCCRVAR
ncbi:hypothetical protein TNIN_265191 [Trichonephila inaurata madagascariensis]|uniref:Uncharacterized protein n=1 Tax=Trichonephila inaurata madagascariensis TaxID=2747483 RepID=A0A8X7BWL3_9ARAC|nr:hypothetical protein TNIN_265191 [Trichonephila inaurata madagascariensis]